MKIILQSKENSFLLNDIEHQKGSLQVNYRGFPLIWIGGMSALAQDIDCDGQTFDTVDGLQTWISAHLFKNGGGSTGEGVQWSNVSYAPEAGKIPRYSPQGLLSVNQAEFPENAVPHWQVTAMIEQFSQSLIKIDTDNFADPPTSSEMNTKYPSAKVRTTVYIPNAGGAMLKYTKLNATDWEAQPYTIA